MSYRVSPNSVDKNAPPRATIHRSLCMWVQYEWPGPFLTKAKAIAWAQLTGHPVHYCQKCDP